MKKVKTPIWIKLIIVAMTFALVTSPEWVEAIGKCLTEVIVYA
jgi:hypothetical protein